MRPQNFTFVKILATVTGPPDAGFWPNRWDMMRPLAGLTGATMIAAALLFPLEARAQAANGLSNLFGGIFSGPNPAPAQPTVRGDHALHALLPGPFRSKVRPLSDSLACQSACQFGGCALIVARIQSLRARSQPRSAIRPADRPF